MKVICVTCTITNKGMDIKSDDIEVRDATNTFSYKAAIGNRRISKSDMLIPYSMYKPEVSQKCFSTYAYPEDKDKAIEIVTEAALQAFKQKYNEVLTIASALSQQSIPL